MTTTKDALSNGSARFVRIMAIEGIDQLLAECSQADAQAAWTGTDWDGEDVYTGSFFDVQNEQQADPWQPFQSGGRAIVTCLDDAFGVLTHRKGIGAETELTATLDRDDADVSVLDTSAFPTSGEFHIGTECIAYLEANVTSTKFASTTRGMYSPFGTSDGSRYTHDHRVGIVASAPNLQPKVTQYPRTFIGRYVGIWLHTYDENGINSKDDALCIFAGRIAEVRDDPSTLGTVVVCEHVLTDIKEATLGRDMFEGTVRDGFYLSAGAKFDWRDWSDATSGSSVKNANSLKVVASGASGTNEIDEGYYSLSDLFSSLNAWLSAETAASRINGAYTIGLATIPPDGELRVKCYFMIPGVTGDQVGWRAQMPRVVARMMGWDDGGASGPANTSGSVNIIDDDGANDHHLANESYHFYREFAPLRMWLSGGLSSVRVAIDIKGGTAIDQYDSFPANLVPIAADAEDFKWGIFSFDGKTVWRAAFTDNGDGTVDLTQMDPLSVWLANSQTQADFDALRDLARRADDDTPIIVKQVLAFGGRADTMLLRFFYSTGTEAFNHVSHDILPLGFGLAIPGELLGSTFNTSVTNMPGANQALVVFIEKATKFGQIIASDLILRRAFPVWKQGGLKMASWQTPSLALSSATLTESNKAEPAGRKADHRTATLQSDRWAKTIIKIRHSRNLLSESGSAGGGSGSEWQGIITIEDRSAVDEGGDRGDPLTLDARNSYSEYTGTGTGIEDLVDSTFVPSVSLFSHPMTTMRRSLAVPHYESLVPGDVITLSDSFARDHATGERIIANQPATVIRVTVNFGGLKPGSDKPDPMVAEVELMLGESDRIYAYAPSALVTAYNSSTKTLTLSAHEYSESSEDDDVDHLPTGGEIRITEVDPEDPSTALTWTRSISSKSGNDIVHDDVALAGFDSSKEYRVTFDAYSAVDSGQQTKAFQADDADGLIEDEAQPNRFGLAVSTIAVTADDHETLGEMYANVDYGEGKAYDVGSLKGVSRLVDNIIDHKSAICSPVLGAVMENSTYSSGDGWLLVSISPIFLTTALVSAAVERSLSLAPWFRSSDGTETSIRVTLSGAAPIDATVEDIATLPNAASAIWTTTSTTWSAGDPLELPVSVKPSSGIAWLIIECNYKCQTRGLARCIEQERE